MERSRIENAASSIHHPTMISGIRPAFLYFSSSCSREECLKPSATINYQIFSDAADMFRSTDKQERLKEIIVRSPSSERQIAEAATSKQDTESNSKPQLPYKFLWIPLDGYSPTTRFFLLCLGVFCFYIPYGYFQELIFQLKGMKPYGWFLTLVQFKLYSAFALLESRLNGKIERRIPWKIYLIIATLTVATMGFSNSSVAYLNYPTQVVFKSCKLIPVLLGSFFIQGKKIGVLDCLAAIFMSLGLMFFTLADVEVSPNYDTTGIIMISLALMADAAIGNVQEKNMKSHNATNTEVIFYSYSIGFVMILTFLLATNQLFDAHRFCAQHPLETYGYFTIFSITGYFGVQLVLILVQTSGVFVAVTVTTCRKALTVILSFLTFTKPFTFQYVWSGSLVILGIYLNVYGKTHHLSMGELTAKGLHLCHNLRQKMRHKSSSESYSV